jgi:anthranilate phosphoribosyltransferase
VIEGESLRVVNYTHPEYPEKLGQFFQSRGHAALLMRGHEGEPTCSLTRIPERTLCHGLNTPLHFPEQQYEPLTNAPLSSDSVAFTEAVVSGRAAVPKIIDDFCDMLAGEIRRLSA